MVNTYENFFNDEMADDRTYDTNVTEPTGYANVTGGGSRRLRYDDLAEDKLDDEYDFDNLNEEDALFGGARQRMHSSGHYVYNKYTIADSTYGVNGGRFESSSPYGAAAKAGSKLFRALDKSGVAAKSAKALYVVIKSTHHGENKYVKYNAYNLERESLGANFKIPKGDKEINFRFKIKVSKAELPAEYVELNKEESKKRAAAKRAAKRIANGEAPKPKAKKPAAPKAKKAAEPKAKKAAEPKAKKPAEPKAKKPAEPKAKKAAEPKAKKAAEPKAKKAAEPKAKKAAEPKAKKPAAPKAKKAATKKAAAKSGGFFSYF